MRGEVKADEGHAYTEVLSTAGSLFLLVGWNMNRPMSIAGFLHELPEFSSVTKEFPRSVRGEGSARVLDWSCQEQAIPRRSFHLASKQRREDTGGCSREHFQLRT